MIQKHIDKLEQEIKDNLEMIELLDSKRAEHVKNSSEYQAYLNLYMFAYAVRMGEKYDKLDTDLKLSESDFPPEMKNIVGNNLNSVINKCLIGSGDKDINEDFAQIKYFQLLNAKIDQREDELLRLRLGASDDVKKEIDNSLKNLSQCKEKLKKMGETL